MDPEWYENKDVLTNLLTHVDLKTAGQLGKLNKIAADVIADQEVWRLKTWKLLGVDNIPEVNYAVDAEPIRYAVDWKGVYIALYEYSEYGKNIFVELMRSNNISGVKFILGHTKIPIGGNLLGPAIYWANIYKDKTILKLISRDPRINPEDISRALSVSAQNRYKSSPSGIRR